MARKTREELRLDEEQRVALEVENNRSVMPVYVLFQLARAHKLGLSYKVEYYTGEETVAATIFARESDLGYTDRETILIYANPSKERYTRTFELYSFANLNDRVEDYKEEQKRIESVKQVALAKLTDDEKKALGLR